MVMDRENAEKTPPPSDSSGTNSSDTELLPYRPRMQPRAKRFAPRAKTGCDTCRPKIASRLMAVRPSALELGASSATNRSRYAINAWWLAGHALAFITEMPLAATRRAPSHSDCLLTFGVRLDVEVQAPMSSYTSFGDGPSQASYNAKAELRKGGMETHSFIAMVTQHQIVCAANAIRVSPMYGGGPEMNHLWQLLFRHMTATVSNVNGYIKGGVRPSYIVYQICNLLGIELGLAIPTWRLHAEGLAAYIRGLGGMENMTTLHLSAYKPIQYGLIMATACNTTSPPADQIHGFSDWSRKEVRLAYSHTGRPMLPCPTALFLEIIEITRLRRLVYTGERSRTQLFRIAVKIARAVDEFAPECWTESYDTHGPKCLLSARLFKTATTLYALLSLPPRLSNLFASQPPTSNVMTSIQHHRDKLFALFAEAWEELSRKSLGWPSAVLGVAVVDNPEQCQQLRTWLDAMRWIPSTDGGTHNLMPLLKEFWVSGSVFARDDIRGAS
ncbi:hypothetical protein NLG97_g5876 [Lecanicillium saksenae]|uniref:Uncharacterized protein n=1 Tax=Lecanicillium saksenae TaxID=468837 RepID=A0ACC1QSD2_9HYPO|nr:hypothetical protein NLG97_g5876 [Lecanicillium saksenae]